MDARVRTLASNDIFVATNVTGLCKTRIINQYYKKTAKNAWGYRIQRYHDLDFLSADSFGFPQPKSAQTASQLSLR